MDWDDPQLDPELHDFLAIEQAMRPENRPKGRTHCVWRRLTPEGYVVLRLPDGTWVNEHRYLMEQHLERKLTPQEHVHHKNEVKNDNRIENLEVLDHVEHLRLHNESRRLKVKPSPPADRAKIVGRIVP